MNTADAIVIGLGEVGAPLRRVLAERWTVAGVDITEADEVSAAPILHVCYPFQIPDFTGTTARYVDQFQPESVVIHSTVAPGTTSTVQQSLPGVRVYYSPVRGKHSRMQEHLRHYRKFLAGALGTADPVRRHLEEAGFEVELMDPPAALEMAKLLETSYFGVLIAWAQEVSRFAESVGSDYQTMIRFVEEVPFLPSNYFPGEIGGHCVMANIALLKQVRESGALEFVEDSNARFTLESSRH